MPHINILREYRDLNIKAHFSTEFTKSSVNSNISTNQNVKNLKSTSTIPPTFPQKIQWKERRKIDVHFEKCVSHY